MAFNPEPPPVPDVAGKDVPRPRVYRRPDGSQVTVVPNPENPDEEVKVEPDWVELDAKPGTF